MSRLARRRAAGHTAATRARNPAGEVGAIHDRGISETHAIRPSRGRAPRGDPFRQPDSAASPALDRDHRRLQRSDAHRRPADRLHEGPGVQGRDLSGQPDPAGSAGAEGLCLGRRSAGNPRRRHRRRARRYRGAVGRGAVRARREGRGDVHRRFRRGRCGRRGGAGPHGGDGPRARDAPAGSELPRRVRRAHRLLRDLLQLVRQRLADPRAHLHRQPVGRLRHPCLRPGAQPRHRRVALRDDRQRGRHHHR